MFRDYRGAHEPQETNSPSVWPGVAIWLLALGAALVVYLLTGNPLYAAAIPYFQAVSKPLRCALWLGSVDPSPARARAYLLFYLALAFWMAALSAFVSFLTFLMVDLKIGQPPPMNLLAFTMLALFLGALIGSAIGVVGIAGAAFGRIKIWVNPDLRNRCGGDFSRLGKANLGHNFTFWIVVMSLVVPTLLVGAAILAWSLPDVGPNDVSPISFVIAVLFFLVGPFAMVALSALLCSRIVADSPAECWDDSTGIP